MKQKSKKKSGHLTYHDQIKHLTQIGVALYGEKNIDRLLDMESRLKTSTLTRIYSSCLLKKKFTLIMRIASWLRNKSTFDDSEKNRHLMIAFIY